MCAASILGNAISPPCRPQRLLHVCYICCMLIRLYLKIYLKDIKNVHQHVIVHNSNIFRIVQLSSGYWPTDTMLAKRVDTYSSSDVDCRFNISQLLSFKLGCGGDTIQA